ncbi:thioredoxin family protein [Candidatus Nomurabacteria bacterium]|nr:thioredoxin family protein [Candidatus Nomurabacteria bacterium]USN94750.1 MAG: thioredoxin family protein [Candidatus Nomurabacteria bacterium]
MSNKNIIIVILILVAGSLLISFSNKKDQVSEVADSFVEENASQDSMVFDHEGEMMEEGENMVSEGTYEAYDPAKLALAEDGKVVLFFHAPWCPTCSLLNKDIEANLSSIPEGVHILKVDYDTSSELKQKYGVTYQHTLVLVDKDGNMIEKWSGGDTLETILEKII